MKKNTILVMLAFVFAIGLTTSDADAFRAGIKSFTKKSPVTQAQVINLNTEHGNATCFVYPDSRGNYTSIYDIANSGAAMADMCGGCPEGQTCKYSKKNDSWSCAEPEIQLPQGGCPLPPCPGE